MALGGLHRFRWKERSTACRGKRLDVYRPMDEGFSLPATAPGVLAISTFMFAGNWTRALGASPKTSGRE